MEFPLKQKHRQHLIRYLTRALLTCHGRIIFPKYGASLPYAYIIGLLISMLVSHLSCLFSLCQLIQTVVFEVTLWLFKYDVIYFFVVCFCYQFVISKFLCTPKTLFTCIFNFQESLFYTVPPTAMETYRKSIESHFTQCEVNL